MSSVLSLCLEHWLSLVFLLSWIFMRCESALSWRTLERPQEIYVRRNTFFGRPSKSPGWRLVYMVQRE